MPQISRAYATGRVSSLVKSLISPSVLDRLRSASSVAEVARGLVDAGWGDMQDQSGVERRADEHVAKACALMRECTPDTNVTDCFLIKFDILNLKTLIKARILGENEPALSGNGLIDLEKMRHAVSEISYGALPNEYQAVLKDIEAKTAVEVDPIWIDSQLDKLMYSMIWSRLDNARKCPDAIKKLFIAKSDSVNMLIALRAGAMGRDADFAAEHYVTGGELSHEQLANVVREPMKLISITDNKPYADKVKAGMDAFSKGEGLAPLEKQLEDYQTALLRPHRYEIDSILPLVGYFVAREREAAVVRLIVTAKAVGVGEEALKKRMRELYV